MYSFLVLFRKYFNAFERFACQKSVKAKIFGFAFAQKNPFLFGLGWSFQVLHNFSVSIR
jgi:hypothetical protein